MWEADCPDAGEDLRQGDLLDGLLLPVLTLPIKVAHFSGSEPAAGDSALLGLKGPKHYVVVSQCCTIENGNQVAIAPVKSTPTLTNEEALGYLDEEPTDERNFVYSVLRLEDLPEVLEALGRGRYRVVDLQATQSWAGDRSALRAARRARMTPEGRRLLRIKLGFFWGRAEAEDAVALRGLGLPEGVTTGSESDEDGAAAPPEGAGPAKPTP